jgi:hypothetical protein
MKRFIDEEAGTDPLEESEETEQEPDNRAEDYKKYGFSDEDHDDGTEGAGEEENFDDEEEEIDNNVHYEQNDDEKQERNEQNYLTSNYKDFRELNIFYNKLYNFKEFEVFEGKFGNIARIQFGCFNPENYQPEDPIILTDEKGQRVEKVFSYENFFRWKYQQNEKNEVEDKCELELLKLFNIEDKENKGIKSNSRIVEWSDGSYQLLIGNEFFDITVNNTSNTRFAINSEKEHSLMVCDGIKKKMIIKKSAKIDNSSAKRRESYSYEDLRHLKEKVKDDIKVKTFHSYYNKNKFTREEYMSKSNKVSVMLMKQEMKKKENEQKEKDNKQLSKKRERDY